jgi:hypothetical protein
MRVVRLFMLADILSSFVVQNDLKEGRRKQADGSCQTYASYAASQWRKGVE